MQIPKKECIHIADVLQKVKKALAQKDSLQLKALSNQTIHTACNYQNSASISIAVIIYALSKLVERKDFDKIRNWSSFIKKFGGELDLATKAIKENNIPKYEQYIETARKTIESQSISLKSYIEDVLKKASINKGSKLYEHGISLERTAKLLGVSQWELSGYIGQKSPDDQQSQTMNIKQRAKMAMEFFE